MKPFFISIPHAGEVIPPEVKWLKSLPETVLMCDVDRFVDLLYGPAIKMLGINSIIATTHRYVVDLNRLPDDIDERSVEGSSNPAGMFTTGYHWSQTTTEAPLMKEPISMELHKLLTQKYFEPFHKSISAQFSQFKNAGHKKVYHLDAHSMPSMGTAAHRDPGKRRPEIVVSDQDGTSCDTDYKDLVMNSYKTAGFEVAYNWPYKGGRITQTYGQPQKGQHTVQVEMSRALYMDEATKQKKPEQILEVSRRLAQAIAMIINEIN